MSILQTIDDSQLRQKVNDWENAMIEKYSLTHADPVVCVVLSDAYRMSFSLSSGTFNAYAAELRVRASLDFLERTARYFTTSPTVQKFSAV